MIDFDKFKQELHNEFLEKHPKLKSKDSVLAKFLTIAVDIVVDAIAKYDRERSQ